MPRCPRQPYYDRVVGALPGLWVWGCGYAIIEFYNLFSPFATRATRALACDRVRSPVAAGFQGFPFRPSGSPLFLLFSLSTNAAQTYPGDRCQHLPLSLFLLELPVKTRDGRPILTPSTTTLSPGTNQNQNQEERNAFFSEL